MAFDIQKKSGFVQLFSKSGYLSLFAKQNFTLVPYTPLTMRQILTQFMTTVANQGGIFESEKCALINLYLLNDEDVNAFETRVTFDNVGNQFESKACIVL